MNIGYGFGVSAAKLDPEGYEVGSIARALAHVVSSEVEAERDAERARSEPLRGFSAGLLGSFASQPGDPPAYACDTVPWHELVMRPQVLARCSKAIRKREEVVAHAIINLLHPPNWQTMFWYASYLEQGQQIAKFDAALQSIAAGLNPGASATKASHTLNDIKHKRTRHANAQIEVLWRQYEAKGISKNDAAEPIGQIVHLAQKTVRDKLKRL